MDTNTMIRKVREEYKAYLVSKHPEWSESTVSTHVSDAFYIWNNTVIPGFWKVFLNDESMHFAEESVRDYLMNEAHSNRYEERAKYYYDDLKMLKTFFDDVYGGVENCIGDELYSEEIIYEVAKRLFDGTLLEVQALEELKDRVPYFSVGSHKIFLGLFQKMINGEKYAYKANIETTLCFIRNIGRDYGAEKMRNALVATHENIIYYFSKTGNKSNCLRKCCQSISEENGFDFTFGEDMCYDIVPEKGGKASLADEDVLDLLAW